MRLVEITVRGLYGRFTHSINFENDDHITILTAPNGFGKTAVINILYGLFSSNFELILKHSFAAASLKFDNGSTINLRPAGSDLIETAEQNSTILHIETIQADGVAESWQFDSRLVSTEYRSTIDRYLPYVEKHGDLYYDGQDGEYLSFYDIQVKYADFLPMRLRQQEPLATRLKEILSSIECHLIETQRLLRVRAEQRRGASQTRKTQAVVEQNAADLASKIELATRAYASEAQRLDQSFPQRVLQQLPGSAPSEEGLRQQLKELEKKRKNLAEAGLIEATVGPFITDYDQMSEAAVRNVLNLYARDAAKKLETFSSIYERINLFLEIVNDHFTFKNISVTAGEGMAVYDDNRQPISLTSLSSGEQHILVLIYDLLFKVAPNALILVDEPELSLHVAWQKRFIADLQKIQGIQPIDVVVATHSPQIINDRWDLVQELAGGSSSDLVTNKF